MKKFSLFLYVFLSLYSFCHGQSLANDSLWVYGKSTYPIKKRPWRAALETVGLNVAVWGFDRFIMNEDFARVSLKTIKNNIRHGFVWDNDQFSTNLFAHPYHGSLYFNTARSNGLNFWESAPYSLAGSLMWEFCGEREPAAINDLMATTFGGMALGEVTFRISSLILDDSKRGFHRFCREFLGIVISPVRGLNRLFTGEMWKHKTSGYKYQDFDRIPIKFSINAGDRYLADDNYLFRGENSPYIQLIMTYGAPFNKKQTQPYDYFSLNATFNLAGNQPIISEVNLTAKLWGKKLHTNTDMETLFGVFQHFNYYDSEEVIDGTGHIPYKISEAASFGPGLIYKLPIVNNYIKWEQRLFINGILLGGSLTDYYNVIDRNYNMGSGFSIKNNTYLDFGHYGNFVINLHHYRIFTWKGYEHKDSENIDPLYLNAQGDKGNVMLTVINPAINIILKGKFKANLEFYYYFRNTHYSYHKDIHFRTFETRIGLGYEF